MQIRQCLVPAMLWDEVDKPQPKPKPKPSQVKQKLVDAFLVLVMNEIVWLKFNQPENKLVHGWVGGWVGGCQAKIRISSS